MWGRVIRGVWLAVIAGAIMLGLSVPASAQSRYIGDKIDVCVRPADAPGLDPKRLIAEAATFDCASPQRSFPSGDYWVVSKPLSARSSEGSPLRVRTSSLFQGSVTLDIVYADGAIVRHRADGRQMSSRIQLGAISQFEVPPRDAAVTRLVWRIDDASNLHGIVLGARLATAEDAAQANLSLGALYAGFAGLAIALIVYNLALWVVLRQGFQLAYCAMAALLLAYCFTSSGALAWAWPDLPNNDRIRLNHALLGAAAAAALVFARSFFEREVFLGWVGRFTHVATVAVLGGGIVFLLAPDTHIGQADSVFAWGFVGVLAVIGPMLWRAWKVKSNYVWLFAFAWAAPVVMAGMRFSQHLGLIPWRFWIDNSTIFALAFEALLSSVAIAYRIRLLSNERDFAVAQEAVQRKLADTDPLTGLLNRRAFLDQAIGRGGMQQLLLIDIDHFKSVNETLGHDGGDEVLRVFARVLRQVVPEGGLVARLGGEEFAVLAPPGAEIDPDALLARLRAARMPFDLDVTASIGLCRGGMKREADWKSLYRAADRALFDAKAAGRDRVRRSETLLAEAA
ncbi:GGDEF domain-containing protein [Sphingomonas sp. AX6]|uniref:GGDEF domain-containing protein n=1 Tax=Sphingomonas sp. AX6 TaxID=2653171 RepID=UPI0012F112CB|nr:diguanylate cyclase [Sphingomonas sp. AX6]VXD00426.1 putative Diguanylate cyclase [Sphingomonas sp. AX6]